MKNKIFVLLVFIVVCLINAIFADKVINFEETKQSAEQGDAIAQFQLGLFYYNGLGITQDNQETFKWFEKSAKQGLLDAQYGLGLLYDTGEGVRQDFQEAFKWYKKAAEKGDYIAQLKVGEMYFEGRGVEENNIQSLMWLYIITVKEDEKVLELRGEIEKQATQEQIDEAKKLANEWKLKVEKQ